jgi:hypothetical protein
MTYKRDAIFFPDPSDFQHLPSAGVLVLTGKASETPKPQSRVTLRLTDGKTFEGVFYKGTVQDIHSANVPRVKSNVCVHFQEKKE